MNKKYTLLLSLSFLLAPIVAQTDIALFVASTTIPEYAKFELNKNNNTWQYEILTYEEEQQAKQLFEAVQNVDVEAVRTYVKKGYNCNVVRNSVWFFTPLSDVIFHDTPDSQKEVATTQDRLNRVEIARILLIEGNAFQTMHAKLGYPTQRSAKCHSRDHPAFCPLFEEAQPRYEAWLKENGKKFILFLHPNLINAP